MQTSVAPSDEGPSCAKDSSFGVMPSACHEPASQCIQAAGCRSRVSTDHYATRYAPVWFAAGPDTSIGPAVTVPLQDMRFQAGYLDRSFHATYRMRADHRAIDSLSESP